MAIYHLAAKAISRGAGKSVTAKAAYNARAYIANERTGETHDYRRKAGLVFSGVFAPANAPDWAKDRSQLWNAVEHVEKRKDSTLAREYEVSLPHELTDEQRRYLVQDFIKENFTRKGYVVDVNIHEPDAKGDQRNHHAHILVTDRRLENGAFAADKKERHGMGNNIAELERIRGSWEKHVNHHLERWGIEARVDHRTLTEQGIDREPTFHRGPHVDAMEQKGIVTDLGEAYRMIEARNDERSGLQQETVELARERETLEASPTILPASSTPDRARDEAPDMGRGLEKGAAKALGAAGEAVGKGVEVAADAFSSLFEAPKPAATPKKVLKFFADPEPPAQAPATLDWSRYLKDKAYREQIDRQQQEDEERRRRQAQEHDASKNKGRPLTFFQPDPNDKDRDR